MPIFMQLLLFLALGAKPAANFSVSWLGAKVLRLASLHAHPVEFSSTLLAVLERGRSARRGQQSEAQTPASQSTDRLRRRPDADNDSAAMA
jgi:hypothetical protein